MLVARKVSCCVAKRIFDRIKGNLVEIQPKNHQNVQKKHFLQKVPGVNGLIIDKSEKNCQIIDVAIPEDGRVAAKEDEKVEKYQDLGREVRKIRGVRTKVIPIVVGALGTKPLRLKENLRTIGVDTSIELIQRSVLLG